MRVTTGAGPVRASTGNGDIAVTVPGGIDADFDASTGWGSIHTDFPIHVAGSVNLRHIRGTIGRGGQRIHMSTGFGTIELRQGS